MIMMTGVIYGVLYVFIIFESHLVYPSLAYQKAQQYALDEQNE